MKANNPRFKYKNVTEGIAVFLDGRRVGVIKATQWAYFPATRPQDHGEQFETVTAVKESIEAE